MTNLMPNGASFTHDMSLLDARLLTALLPKGPFPSAGRGLLRKGKASHKDEALALRTAGITVIVTFK